MRALKWFLMVAFVPLGCSSSVAPSPVAAKQAVAVGGVPLVATAEAAPVGHPSRCEVEITGTVRVPKQAAGAPAPMTFVALGDCLAPEPQVLGFSGSTNGRFFVEVFAPWGSDLTLCAASEPAPGEASGLYGKAKLVMHAEKGGEVEFHDVVVDLAAGPPKKFAHTAGMR